MTSIEAMSAQPAFFLDTNILIYATSLSPDHAAKAPAARAWVQRRDWGVSTQVLMEFFANARRPKHRLQPTAAEEFVQRIAARRPVQAMDRELVLDGALLIEADKLRDAEYLAAAKLRGDGVLASRKAAPNPAGAISGEVK